MVRTKEKFLFRYLGIAPGGGKESMFGMDWGQRKGYAVVAATAQVGVFKLPGGGICINGNVHVLFSFLKKHTTNI